MVVVVSYVEILTTNFDVIFVISYVEIVTTNVDVGIVISYVEIVTTVTLMWPSPLVMWKL